jgi:DNA-binding response OmpR family regulator
MERILVVDDEIHVVRLLQKFLTSKAYEVYTATNGLEAIQKVKDVRPHIVLLDILMPGMGGIDTLKEIKKINSKIVVIMVTAVIDEELAKRAIQLGADEYIIKPFDLNYIETCLMVKVIQLLGSC